ncbi:histone acetyltransferase subunit NuA4-domain-containing protein [Collybia nuda]|uniref:Chromatin modification-related protein EAF6 n=1 Tax=Collybia nuda TaxID=64659 RepID=A0A9P5YJ02_9AGAR|nr:histone acetyltransferase subunit NuA4-domain-containing protein [Collybia nuda]
MAEAAAGPSTDNKARYEALKSDLIKALPKKRKADKQLAQIEVQIYNIEASYLTETATHSGGNIIQGFEGYLKNQGVGRRKYEVNDHDRLFSRSSLTYQKSLDLMGEGDDSTATIDEYIKQPTPGLTTIAVPPATRNQELSMAQQKRLRDKEYQRKKRASASLRSTGDSDEDIVSAASTSSRRPTKRARMADDD